MKLRDRDAILTGEGLIFRVIGYSHPPQAFICDAEYASAKVFTSKDPRAPRNGRNQLYYKFYNDEGWNLIFNRFTHHTIYHDLLQKKIVGVKKEAITEAINPEKRLQTLIETHPKDELHDAMQRVLTIILERSGLSKANFGVFGSMLHGFHHPKFSDIDLLVYGKSENNKVRETLAELYADNQSGFKNEFEVEDVMEGKQWHFKDYSIKEFIWHQKRKQIYGLFKDTKSGRTIKAEFEPVKAWSEIVPEYNPQIRITRKGWVRVNAKVTADSDAPFIPSVYGIKPLNVLNGPRNAIEAMRVISYMEEFRAQVVKDEKICIEGTLEEVTTPNGNFHQIALTYCPRYYEQVLKVTA